MNVSETNEAIRNWMLEHEPHAVPWFDTLVEEENTVTLRQMRLAFKAGVAYQQAKDLPGLLKRGEGHE